MSEYRTDEAFGPVPLWLTESKVSDRAVRLYALLSGMRDYGTDMATVGRKLLASKLRCSLDSLDRAKAELEDIEAITVERGSVGGQIARNVYTIHRVNPGSRTRAATPLAAPERPTPSRTDAATYEREPKNETSSSPNTRVPKTIGAVKVTNAEHDLTDGIMAAFNEATGKRFAGREWRESIIRRVREHPDVSLEQHTTIIKQQMAHPWWKGDATPAVIYGNGKVFDRALNGALGAEPQERPRRFSTV